MNPSAEKVLTVGIAAYNAEPYLAGALDSLVGCRCLPQLDILVIDDGSTDGTRTLAEAYRRRYPDSVRVISRENGGHGATINEGIRNLKGTYFRILDADDRVDSAQLDRLVAHLAGAEADLVCNPYYLVNALHPARRHRCRPYPLRSGQAGVTLTPEQLPARFSPDMHAMTYRSELLKRLGPLIDEHCSYVDQEYAMLPLPLVRTVNLLDFPVYEYLVGYPAQSIQLEVKQAREAEHLRVVRRLAAAYAGLGEQERVSCGRLLKRGTAALIAKQYGLYVSLPTAACREKLLVFDRWLQEQSPELYAAVPPRIRVLRRFSARRGSPVLRLYLGLYRGIIRAAWSGFRLLLRCGL